MRTRWTFFARRSALAGGALACLLLAVPGGAQTASTTLLDDVHTVVSAQTAAPIEHDFDIAVPGTYQVQLTDVGATLTPAAPIGSIRWALTTADGIVGTPLTAAGTYSFTAAAPGTYRVHVVGAPRLDANSEPIIGSGLIALQVSATSGGVTVGSPLFAWSDNIALPAQVLPTTVGFLSDTFTLTAQTAGSYQIAVSDLSWPQPLGSAPTLLLAGAGITVILPDPSTSALQKTVTLPAGTYQILGLGQVAQNATAGLYEVSVGPLAAPVYSRAVPVGDAISLGTTLLADGAATLAAADLSFPVGLNQLQTAVVRNGALVSVIGTSSSAFQATAGSYYETFVTAQPASAGVGSYAVQLSQNGQSALNVARAVTAPGSLLIPYSFDADIPTAASYTVNLTDFQLPAKLASANVAAVQGLTTLGSGPSAPANVSISAVAGPLTLLGFAQPGSAGSLLDVSITSGQTLVFDATQGVGVAFTPVKLSVPTGGSYQLSATDLAFPTKFTDFAVLITQGGASFGSVIAGGTAKFQAVPGNYIVNFLAHPSSSATDSSANAGTYALSIVTAPPPPTVTLGVDNTSVSSGAAVRLNWTSTNATTCVGSGGGWTNTYTGTQAATGSAESPSITANTTFTLTCAGAGGQAAQSVTVSVNVPAPAKSGGGSIDIEMLLALAVTLLIHRGAARQGRVS